MKNLFILLAIMSAFSACKKDGISNPIIVEPFPDQLLSSDTTTSGQKLGFSIGASCAGIYSKIQEVRTVQGITYLGVVGNVFTDVDSLKTRLPLYQSVFLDESVGTGTGIQIAFTAGKVSSIFTNDGVKLSRWPANGTDYVATGNQVTDIYSKLAAIKKLAAYATKFQRISIFFKDPVKAYDARMAQAPEWYYSAPTDAKRYNVVHLNFKAGVLVSIYTSLYQGR